VTRAVSSAPTSAGRRARGSRLPAPSPDQTPRTEPDPCCRQGHCKVRGEGSRSCHGKVNKKMQGHGKVNQLRQGRRKVREVKSWQGQRCQGHGKVNKISQRHRKVREVKGMARSMGKRQGHSKVKGLICKSRGECKVNLSGLTLHQGLSAGP
jgi:hypothetical protein